uniref:Uncharacterized protein n=1 Tax=Candidatus Kentrum sp. TC TaxID=2126339 RepID=A0A450YAS0_9GAMM|nr:MAG: hypothetical protein BECKTC1821D_GA0114238_100517 [Candidatus Kentron sp. TC]
MGGSSRSRPRYSDNEGFEGSGGCVETHSLSALARRAHIFPGIMVLPQRGFVDEMPEKG